VNKLVPWAIEWHSRNTEITITVEIEDVYRHSDLEFPIQLISNGNHIKKIWTYWTFFMDAKWTI